MTYELYKVLHIISIIFIAVGIGVTFLGDTSKKSVKITSGIASFLLLVAGMGLFARIGGGKFPGWVIAKLVIWLILSVSVPVLGKRLKNGRGYAFIGMTSLLGLAIILAVYKPF